MLRKIVFMLLAAVLAAVPCGAKTLVISGKISSEMTVTQQVTFSVEQRLSELVYRFPVPAGIDVPSISQRLADHSIAFEPQPVSVKDERDGFGNSYKVVTWRDLAGDARANIVFTADLDATLDPMVSKAGFPLGPVPEELKLYLSPTKQVQSSDPKVTAVAAELTQGAESEYAAVDAILNYVTDHIHYESPPKAYDALYGLTTGTGNCQNFAHLACALLRASGIPARVAVGLTLKDKWKIPLDDEGSSLVQGMAEGLHAWIEVWFPGLGWLPCDPQQSKEFTSTRHIKYAHGPECSGIGTTWKAAPILPRYSTVLSSKFSRDLVKLKLKGSGSEPRGYMASSEMIASAPQGASPPVVAPPVSDADQKLAEQKLAEQKLAEQKLAEQKLAEQKLADQKQAELKLAEQKLAELKLAEQRLAEKKLAEQKLEEQRLAELKLAEQRLLEQRLQDQRLAEQRLAEQRLAERKLAEERLAQQKIDEQKLAEEKLAELKLAEEKLAEKRLAEQRLGELRLAEQKLAEQKLAERRLAEQRLADQKLAEARLVEQKLAAQKLAEQKLIEKKLAEQKLIEQRLSELRQAEHKLAEKRASRLREAKRGHKPHQKPSRRSSPPPIKADGEGRVVFGNQRFPQTLTLYTTNGNRGEASLDQETAEYVTSSSVYAQAFVTDRPLRFERVSLAAKKFGGDGTVYLDIVADDHGKPGLTNGVRSQPVYLENVRRLPGYGWLDFNIPSDTDPFPPGKYWVVLRRSGEAILNWYYTPGKPYGGPDDTRSTARGWQWEDILTYDFVFKVAGREVR